MANSERDQMAPCSQGGVSATTEGASQELGRRPDDPCAPYTAASLQYPEYHEDPAAYGDNMHTPSPYPSSRSRQPDLVCDTVREPIAYVETHQLTEPSRA